MERKGALIPPVLVALMREGPSARTSFKIAFAQLTDIDYPVVERVVEEGDLDTLALLCRGAHFDRALFVSLAVGLDRERSRPGGRRGIRRPL